MSSSIKHHPQIIDRDTEVFKNKLESILNKFKIDTLSEYMEAKKSLLEEQADVISGEKTQFELKLRSKEAELKEVSEELAREKLKNDHMEKVIKNMSLKIRDCYRYKRMVQTTGRAFMGWKMMTYYSRLRNRVYFF